MQNQYITSLLCQLVSFRDDRPIFDDITLFLTPYIYIYYMLYIYEGYFECLQISPRSGVAVSDYNLWGAGELNTEIRELQK